MMNPVLHVEIPATDLQRACRFYAQWLQCEVQAPVDLHGCRMAYLPFDDDGAGASVALVSGEGYLPAARGARLYFGVDALQASLARALQAGAVLRFGPAQAGDWHVAEILDSEGNLIALQAEQA
ncbi:VOC family protein [Stenotrophomonas sp. 24(2023)]|uniref:VOC family protein n=1 Tax=Stenotrophomonas sp. 24(2023) TaxID=3068324 RepID=UPI0027E06668|nr:VOC family protein [Stenotrophomonas sp. 24(2023)]WMJ70692.1 VOC family protein [Stenotrophomonas sp. 24(2023)]